MRHRQQRTVWQKEQRRKARTKHNRDLSPDLIERFLEQETLRRRPWARAQALAAKTEAA